MTYLLSSRKFSDGLVPNASVEAVVLFEFKTTLFESETISVRTAQRSREPSIDSFIEYVYYHSGCSTTRPPESQGFAIPA